MQMTEDEFHRLHRDLATAVISFHEAGARRLGMTAAERKCAGLIAELGETTPKQLAEATGLSTGAITGIVDRLERAGYAKREPNPKDRRSVIIRASNTDRLAKETQPIFASLTEAMSALDARYSPEQRALILKHLQDTIAILREQMAKIESSPGLDPGSAFLTSAAKTG
jgi:DNA-binding MarR family transcriptional regulator